jgi:hypothetical protein
MNHNQDPAADAGGGFTSGSITFVLDAPVDDPVPKKPFLPKTFRSSLDLLPRPGNPKGLKEINASGSAQYSKGQLEAMIGSGRVRKPLVIVDLRQESHGFLLIREPVFTERQIAVGWYVERDWINVGKGLASIEADETGRLAGEAIKSSTTVNLIQKPKTAEDGIDTAKPFLVRPAGFFTERNVAIELGLEYLRLPTTDHVRPRDSEVDEFVRFALGLAPGTWLHFHCRGGDGRTTTFFVMHDIMHNAPEVSVEDILNRQHLLGGSELGKLPLPENFAYPFADERVKFVSHFYNYVCAAKPQRYAMTWSAWVAAEMSQAT